MKCVVLPTDGSHLKSTASVFSCRDIVLMNMSYCDEYLIAAAGKERSEIEQEIREISDIAYRWIDTSCLTKKQIMDNICQELQPQEGIIVFDEERVNPAGYHPSGVDYKKGMLEAIRSMNRGKICHLGVENDGQSYDMGIYLLKADVFHSIKEDLCDDLFANIDEVTLAEKILITAGKQSGAETEKVTQALKPVMVKLSPAFKDYLWGGTKLREIFGKKTTLDIVAESWEVSAHPDGLSTVAEGKYAGMTLAEFLGRPGGEALGWKCRFMSDFPILIKFIDAKNPLSIQVHPNDEYALVNENEYGKNEMWYILEADEGAGIYCGFNRETSAGEVRKRIEDNTILEILNWVPAKKGDVFFIKAGTVHAIGAGIMICEIQQSSNCTYRLYDYDRKDKNGNRRELHVDKAIDVLDYHQYDNPLTKATNQEIGGNTVRQLAHCKYFNCVSYRIEEEMSLVLTDKSFLAIVCVGGEGEITLEDEKIEFHRGESLFITAGKGVAHIHGNCEMVITEI